MQSTGDTDPLLLLRSDGAFGDGFQLTCAFLQTAQHLINSGNANAVNGKEGVEAFRRNREKISIVILDLIMPVMDGRKAFEEIRLIDPGARIVISTGYSGNEDVDRLKEMGASAILSKPYSYDTMTKVVNQLNRP